MFLWSINYVFLNLIPVLRPLSGRENKNQLKLAIKFYNLKILDFIGRERFFKWHLRSA